MTDIHIDYPASELNYQRASFLAKNAARQHQMHEPAIVAWHSPGAMSPDFAGGDPDTWWEKYGEGNGGGLEISVGDHDEYTFIVAESEGYEGLGSMPLRNLKDAAGTEYVCYTPLLGEDGVPTLEACAPLDEWMADQY